MWFLRLQYQSIMTFRGFWGGNFFYFFKSGYQAIEKFKFFDNFLWKNRPKKRTFCLKKGWVLKANILGLACILSVKICWRKFIKLVQSDWIMWDYLNYLARLGPRLYYTVVLSFYQKIEFIPSSIFRVKNNYLQRYFLFFEISWFFLFSKKYP